MPFDIFRVRTVKGANIVGLLLGGVVFANFFLLTLYVQNILGLLRAQDRRHVPRDRGHGGGRRGRRPGAVDQVGVKPIMAIGLALLTLGMLWYTQVPVDGSYVSDLLPGYLLVGVGLAFAFVPISIAALAGVSHDEAGLASGLINTSQQIGGAVGVALASTVFTNHLGSGRPTVATLTDAYALGFWVLAGIAFAGFVATLVFIRKDEMTSVDGDRNGLSLGPAAGLASPVRGEEVELGPGRDDPARVDHVVRRVVVALDLVHRDRLRDPRLLVEVAGVRPEVRVVDDSPAVALEMAVVDGVEAHERRKEPPVGLGRLVPDE